MIIFTLFISNSTHFSAKGRYLKWWYKKAGLNVINAMTIWFKRLYSFARLFFTKQIDRLILMHLLDKVGILLQNSRNKNQVLVALGCHKSLHCNAHTTYPQLPFDFDKFYRILNPPAFLSKTYHLALNCWHLNGTQFITLFPSYKSFKFVFVQFQRESLLKAPLLRKG